RITRLIVPDRRSLALVAMLFTAFNPMFLFISVSVNNDNLITAVSTAALWIMLLILKDKLSVWRATHLAVILALAGLSKLSGLTLYPVAAGLLLILLFQRQITLRQALLVGSGCAVAFAVIAGWWYVRNLQLYGDLTGLTIVVAIMKPRQTPYTVNT